MPRESPTDTLLVELRKWESSEGSDPYSYGYNSDTPAEGYRNSSYILKSLVDIVAKNGNYLIDIGPTANGTIVEPSRESLLKVGEWLSFAYVPSGFVDDIAQLTILTSCIRGEAIYNTTYWYVSAEDPSSDLRFVCFQSYELWYMKHSFELTDDKVRCVLRDCT